MAKQLLGRVAMDFKGEFNSSFAYEKLDVVVYEGCSYCALKETKGNLPTNEEFFTLLVRKPVEGLDYFTEDEKEEFVSRITDDANSLFNQNVESKTKEFNTNHQDKVNDFNNNYDTKLSSFNSNYDSKVKSFDNNVNNQTTTFNENVVEKQKEFDDNVTNQTETFNTNATNKINEYDTDAIKKLNDYNSNDNDKLKAYNDNASTKVEEYNANANNKVEEFNTNAEEKTNEFNSTANAQKITSLSNEFYRVKDEVLETGEASDTFIHLEDSSMSELQELEIEGVCQQKTTNGINLLPEVADKSARTSGGVTLTFSENNKMNLNGTTADKSIYFDMKLKETISLTKDVYVHIRNNVGNGNVAIALLLDNSQKGWHSLSDINTISNLTDIKSDEFEVNTLRLFINPNQTVDVTLQPSLEYAPDITEFEPYTGGNASPNPEYPQKIKTITENFNLTSCGKNLLNTNAFVEITNPNEKVWTSLDGITSFYSQSKIEISEVFCNFKAGRTYAISIKESSNIYGSPQFVTLDGTRVVTQLEATSKIYTATENVRVYPRYRNELANTPSKLILQVEEAPSQTTFEEYISSQITANIPDGEFIGKLDDTYKDTLKIVYNEDEGQYHLILNKVIKTHEINDTAVINEVKEGFYIGTYSWNVVKKGPTLTKYFTTYTSYQEYVKMNNGAGFLYDVPQFYIKMNGISNANELKSWLSTHPFLVYYATATPYTIDLGPIEMPLSYNEVTNIFTDSDLLPKINAKYYRNFKQTIKNLNDNIDGIKNDYVKNSDVASSSKAGILKIGNGCYLKSNTLTASVYNYDAYQTRGNEFFISKGTLENVLKAKISELKSELGVSTTDESEETE